MADAALSSHAHTSGLPRPSRSLQSHHSGLEFVTNFLPLLHLTELDYVCLTLIQLLRNVLCRLCWSGSNWYHSLISKYPLWMATACHRLSRHPPCKAAGVPICPRVYTYQGKPEQTRDRPGRVEEGFRPFPEAFLVFVS